MHHGRITVNDLVEVLGVKPEILKECQRAYRHWIDNFQWPTK